MASKPATDEKFFDALIGEDDLGAVVRAHIHIETRLQLVVEAFTRHPDYLPSLRYEQKAKLAVALGLSWRILPALMKLGHIRNSFGHRLDVTLTDDMVNELFNCLAEEDQKTIVEAYQMTQKQLNLDWPSFKKSSARLKFVNIAVALDKFLIIAEQEAAETRNV